MQSQIEQEIASKFNELQAWKNENSEQWQVYSQLCIEQMTTQKGNKKDFKEQQAIVQRKPEDVIEISAG